MHTTKLRKVRGWVMLTVPPALLDVLNLTAGTAVGITVEEGRLVVSPTPAKRYKLADLIAECDPAADLLENEQSWTADAPAGRELI